MALANEASTNHAAWAAAKAIGLDEWVGIAPQLSGTCASILKKQVFGPLQMRNEQLHLFNGINKDLNAECMLMNEYIHDNDGIALALVGVGLNSHIGFNEPPANAQMAAHVATLSAETIASGKNYFDMPVYLQYGLTVGMQQLLEATQVLILATGSHKAAIIQKALEEEITAAIPLSLLRNHRGAVLMLDEAAASQLNNKQE